MEHNGRLSNFGLATVDESLFHTFLSERPSCMYNSSPNSSPEMYQQPKMFKFISEKENSRDSMCKRKLDFNHNNNYLGIGKPTTAGVARRNERERNRVKLINLTFATLREHIPNGCKLGKSKKMSKVDTLKAAIDYIRHLQDVVDEHDAVSAVLDGNCEPKQQHVPAGSPFMDSPSPSSSSETQELSNEEEELLDFTNWF